MEMGFKRSEDAVCMVVFFYGLLRDLILDLIVS